MNDPSQPNCFEKGVYDKCAVKKICTHQFECRDYQNKLKKRIGVKK